MNGLDDPRVQFYLRHRERIDEWAAISDEASSLVHDLLEDEVGGEIEALAGSLDSEVEVLRTSWGDWSTILIYRPSWKQQDNAPPVLGIGVEWPTRAVLLSGPEEVLPYFGVRTFAVGDERRLIRSRFAGDDLVGVHRDAGYESFAGHWPAWSYYEAEDDYWVDPAAHVAEIVSRVEAAWKQFASLVDDVVAELYSSE